MKVVSSSVRRKLVIGVVLIVLALVGGWYFVIRSNIDPIVVPPQINHSVSRTKALQLIQQCQATGTYSLHNGEVGLTLKDNTLKPINGVTEQYLQDSQNPSCPFTRATME